MKKPRSVFLKMNLSTTTRLAPSQNLNGIIHHHHHDRRMENTFQFRNMETFVTTLSRHEEAGSFNILRSNF